MNTKLIASRIKEIRTTSGLTQTKFGQLLSVSQDTISLWEKGNRVPTTEFVVLIAKEFQVSSDYILGLSDY